MDRQGGDDLDDDFVPDDLVAMSEDEDEAPDVDDIAGLLSADEDIEVDVIHATTNNDTIEKKRKRRAKEKERRAKVCCSTAPP